MEMYIVYIVYKYMWWENVYSAPCMYTMVGLMGIFKFWVELFSYLLSSDLIFA